jgi:hypothetical protein
VHSNRPQLTARKARAMNQRQTQARMQQLASEASALFDRAEAEGRALTEWEREIAEEHVARFKDLQAKQQVLDVAAGSASPAQAPTRAGPSSSPAATRRSRTRRPAARSGRPERSRSAPCTPRGPCSKARVRRVPVAAMVCSPLARRSCPVWSRRCHLSTHLTAYETAPPRGSAVFSSISSSPNRAG